MIVHVLRLALLCAAAASLAAQAPVETHIRTLSADAMEGRGLSTKGLAKAADYIENELRAAKVQPAFGKSYRQRFPVKVGVSLGGKNAVEGLAKDDWTPLGFSSAGSFSAPIAFVG
ncbi:MAG TPA: hypothetical protein VHL59_18455, partial [Thermoanaerobaculia bacterium]|nr:hypothetical protein [Thermoanaerobaculia bacterium]